MNRNTTLEARNRKRLKALDIFAYSLEYLKDKALERIFETSGVEYKAEEVLWVITVPAIWKQSAKQFMREAAYQVLTMHECVSFSSLFQALSWAGRAKFQRAR